MHKNFIEIQKNLTNSSYLQGIVDLWELSDEVQGGRDNFHCILNIIYFYNRINCLFKKKTIKRIRSTSIEMAMVY